MKEIYCQNIIWLLKKASCPEMIFGQLAFYKKYYSFEFELEELLVLSPGLLLLELSLLLELVVSLLDDDLFSPSEALAAVAARPAPEGERWSVA